MKQAAWGWRAALVWLIAAAVPALAEPSAAPRIAVVNMSEVLNAYPDAQEAERVLQKDLEFFEARQEAMVARRQEMLDAFLTARDAAQNPMFTDAVRAEREADARRKQAEILEYEQAMREEMTRAQQTLTEREAETMTRLKAELYKLLAAYAKANHLDLILDSRDWVEHRRQLVVFRSDAMDITAAVLAELQAREDASKDHSQ